MQERFLSSCFSISHSRTPHTQPSPSHYYMHPRCANTDARRRDPVSNQTPPISAFHFDAEGWRDFQPSHHGMSQMNKLIFALTLPTGSALSLDHWQSRLNVVQLFHICSFFSQRSIRGIIHVARVRFGWYINSTTLAQDTMRAGKRRRDFSFLTPTLISVNVAFPRNLEREIGLFASPSFHENERWNTNK